MKKFLIAILIVLAFTACGSKTGQATLKDLTSEVKVIKDAPPYPGPAYEDEHWSPIIHDLEKKVQWLNTDLEGYIITTKSEVDGLEVVAPCEVYSLEFRYPYIHAHMVCGVRFDKDITKEDICSKRRDGLPELIHIIGYNDDTPYQWVSSINDLPVRDGEYHYDRSSYTKTYLKGTESLFMFTMIISPVNADEYDKIKEIRLTNGNNAESEELKRNYQNLRRR